MHAEDPWGRETPNGRTIAKRCGLATDAPYRKTKRRPRQTDVCPRSPRIVCRCRCCCCCRTRVTTMTTGTFFPLSLFPSLLTPPIMFLPSSSLSFGRGDNGVTVAPPLFFVPDGCEGPAAGRGDVEFDVAVAAEALRVVGPWLGGRQPVRCADLRRGRRHAGGSTLNATCWSTCTSPQPGTKSRRHSEAAARLRAAAQEPSGDKYTFPRLARRMYVVSVICVWMRPGGVLAQRGKRDRRTAF